MTPGRLLVFALALLPIGCGSSSSPERGGASGTGGSAAAGASGQSAGAGMSSAGTGTAFGGASGTSAGGTSAGGTSAASAGGASPGSAGAAATLADVQAIFDAHCVTCHDKTKGGLPTYPALSLVAGDSKAYLVNKPALETCGGTFVVPGAPDQSYLLRKVSDATPCEGAQMPRPFEVIKPPPLTATEIASIRSWISAGAQ